MASSLRFEVLIDNWWGIFIWQTILYETILVHNVTIDILLHWCVCVTGGRFCNWYWYWWYSDTFAECHRSFHFSGCKYAPAFKEELIAERLEYIIIYYITCVVGHYFFGIVYTVIICPFILFSFLSTHGAINHWCIRITCLRSCMSYQVDNRRRRVDEEFCKPWQKVMPLQGMRCWKEITRDI